MAFLKKRGFGPHRRREVVRSAFVTELSRPRASFLDGFQGAR